MNRAVIALLAAGAVWAGATGSNPPNLALGKAIVPLTNTMVGAPAGVTDGLANTWYSYTPGGSGSFICSFTLDLGASYAIGKINVSTAQTVAVKVWSSGDGVNWTQQHEVNLNAATGLVTASIGAPVTILAGGAYTARYLKYEGRANWNQYVGVNEFEVYEWLGGGPAEPSLAGLTNLAAGKSVSNYEPTWGSTYGHGPELVTDGVVDTFWEGSYVADNCASIYNQLLCPIGRWFNAEGFLRVDLGATQTVQALLLKFPGDMGGVQSLSMSVTDSADSWAPGNWYGFWGDPALIASKPTVTNTAILTFYLPAPVTGRYVWLYVQNWVMETVALTKVSEVEVYGALPAAHTPAVALMSPSGGTVAGQTFTFTFSDPQGWQDLDVVNVLVNNFLDGRYGCYLAYSRPLNVLYLVNDPGTALLPGMVMNGAGAVANSQCAVNGALSSASGSGETLTLRLNLTFATGFAGNRIFYGAARDLVVNNSGWKALGTWTVPGGGAAQLTAGPLTPAQGTGATATLTVTFTNTNGWNQLGVLNVLINDALDGRYACYLAYSRPLNVLYLVNDAGNGLLPGLFVGGTGTLGNNQCTINGAGLTAVGNGNTLTLTIPVSFGAGFKGNRILYLAARDVAENNSGWQARGVWLVP